MKYVEIDAGLRVEAAVRRQFGDGAGNVEIAERIAGPIGVAPEPVDLAAMDRVEHAVGAEDLAVQHRLFQRGFVADQHAVGVDAAAGEAVEAFGDVDAMDLQRRGAACRDVERGAAEAEAVCWELVAVAGDVEENVLVHQPRLAEGDDAVAVGEIAKVVDGAQLDQRHAAARLVVHHFDGEIGIGVVPRGSRAAGDDGVRKDQSENKVAGRHEFLSIVAASHGFLTPVVYSASKQRQ